jgi:Ca2+-binding RTX toxin-like protein
MKRAAFLLSAMAAALVVAGGVALAANIECPNRQDGTCVGTKKADNITGTLDPDFIRARGGDDRVSARGGDGDFSIGGSGKDRVRGNAGSDDAIGGSISGNFETGDLKFADNSDDVVHGGAGNDPTVAGGFGKGGQDRLYGGEGNDTLVSAQRRFPFRGDVRVNKEIVNCGPGQDVAFIDRGVDEVKDNCERKINGFPDMGVEGGTASREGAASGPFAVGPE